MITQAVMWRVPLPWPYVFEGVEEVSWHNGNTCTTNAFISTCVNRVLRETLSTLCYQVLCVDGRVETERRMDGRTDEICCLTPPCNFTPLLSSSSIWTVCLVAQRNKTTAAYHRVQSSKYLRIRSRQWHNPSTKNQDQKGQGVDSSSYVYFFHRYLTKKGLDFDTLWCRYTHSSSSNEICTLYVVFFMMGYKSVFSRIESFVDIEPDFYCTVKWFP